MRYYRGSNVNTTHNKTKPILESTSQMHVILWSCAVDEDILWAIKKPWKGWFYDCCRCPQITMLTEPKPLLNRYYRLSCCYCCCCRLRLCEHFGNYYAISQQPHFAWKLTGFVTDNVNSMCSNDICSVMPIGPKKNSKYITFRF